MNGVLSIALATLCFAAPVRADLTKNEMRLISVKNGAELLIQKGSGGDMTPGWLTTSARIPTAVGCRSSECISSSIGRRSSPKRAGVRTPPVLIAKSLIIAVNPGR